MYAVNFTKTGLVWMLLIAASVSADSDYDYDGDDTYTLPETIFLRCPENSSCFFGNDANKTSEWLYSSTPLNFSVEGNRVTYRSYPWINALEISCYGSNVLTSPSMPQFHTEFRLHALTLFDCPTPVNATYAETLLPLNLTTHELTKLLLKDMSTTPPLTGAHLRGLEAVQELTLTSHRTAPDTEPGFLGHLQKLQALIVSNVRVSTDLRHLPSSLNCLSLDGAALGSLPESLNETLGLITSPNMFWLGEAIWKCRIKNKVTAPSSVEELQIEGWSETEMVPLETCQSLTELIISRSRIGAVPDRAFAACPNLTWLLITDCEEKMKISSYALQGSSIKTLRVKNCDLEVGEQFWNRGANNLTDVTIA